MGADGAHRRRRLTLRAAALLLLAVLAATCVTSVGLVGETSVTYTQARPPTVVVQHHPPVLADGWRTGPLVASQVRPVERLELGPISLPLAVNTYTGAPPDWPAAVVWAVTGSHRAVVALHVGLGGLLVLLVHRFLRFHGTPRSAGIAALLLATDWTFVFYRKVLGGTETLLLAAGLMVLWSLWSRRWKGGRHGAWAIAVGVGLGLMAKVTFVVTLAALGLAALLTRWDRGPLKPPPAPNWLALGGVVVALTAPVWVTLAHHAMVVPPEPHIVSHDFLGLQWERLWSGLGRLFGEGQEPAREAPLTLLWFLGNPLAWFQVAYDSQPEPAIGPLRLVGYGLLVGGTALAWVRREPGDALLRFMSLAVPLQVLGLWLANRDLHHLAQASPMLAIWAALAIVRLVSVRANARSAVGAALCVALAAPWMADGALKLRRTDAVLESINVPHFLSSGQQQLAEMVEKAGTRRLHACDYDLYGMLEPLLPQVEVVHAWGDVSRRFGTREDALDDWVASASGDHLLVVRRSAPMIYNLTPSPEELSERGAIEIARLEDDQGAWAVLYAVPEQAPAVGD